MKNCLFLTLLLCFYANLGAQAQKNRPTESRMLVEKAFIDANREKVLGNYEEAIFLFNEVLKKDSTVAAVYFELANLYSIQKQPIKALEKAAKAFQMSPKSIPYGIKLADLYESSGSFKNAAEVTDKLTKLYPELDSLQFRQGYYLMKASKYEQAIKTFNNLEEKHGVQYETGYNKFLAYLELGKDNKAAAELESIIKAYPMEGDYYETLVKFYESVGMLEKREEVYRKWIENIPDDPRVTIKTAQNAKKANDEAAYLRSLNTLFDDSEVKAEDKIKALMPYLSKPEFFNSPENRKAIQEAINKITETHTNQADVFVLSGDIHQRCRDFKTAEEKYEKALNIAPDKLATWQSFLYSINMLSRYDELLSKSDELISLFPNDASGYFYNGLAALRKEDTNTALASLQQASALSSKNLILKADILAVTAGVYALKKQPEKASEYFDNALKANEKSIYAFYEKGIMLIDSKDYNGALKELNKANDLMPESVFIANAAAKAYIGNKETTQAQQILDKATQNGGDANPETLELSGDVAALNNDNTRAQEFWKKALENGGNKNRINNKIK